MNETLQAPELITKHAINPRIIKILPWVVAIAFFMEMLDATILNTALPAIAKSLHESPLHLHYLVIAYTLTVGIVILLSGWLADTFGTRRVFFWSVAVFTLGSLFCAASWSLSILIAARIIQGVGAALMVPVGRLVILQVYPKEQLLQVFSFVTIPGLLGPLLGPTVGGLLVQYASWHWIFLINIPVGIVGCYLALRLMPDTYGTGQTRFDIRGFLLVSGSMIFLSVAIEGIGELHLKHAQVLILLLLGVLMMLAYWLQAARIDHPLFAPSLFKTTTFTIGILGNLFSRTSSGAMPFLTPLLLQIGLGVSPLKSGLSMIPLAMGAMFSKYLAKKLIPRFGYRRLLLLNTIVLGIAITSMAKISISTPYWVVVLMLCLIGICNSLHFTSINTMTLLDLPLSEASSGNAMFSVVMQLSASFGIAGAAALLVGFETRYGTISGTAGIIQAFSATYICIGLMTIISAIIFLYVPKQSGLLNAKRMPLNPPHKPSNSI